MAEILVKGSRIMNLDVVRSEDDVQPYTILTSAQIERSGAANVEDFLKRHLTMNTAAQTSAQRYALRTGATSSINLRGLGSNETLILINGRRAAGVTIDGESYQPDLNGLPLSAIERIEVLPSSASAIYGGAAMGGVVNFVMKKNYDGGELSYTYNDVTRGNAPTRTLSGSYGASLWDGRTQLMVGGEYSEGTPITLGDRLDLFGRGIETILNNSPALVYSPTRPFAGAATNITSVSATNLVLDDGTPLNARITSVPNGVDGSSDISAGLLANAGTYNLNVSPGVSPFGLGSPMGAIPRTKSVVATLRQSFYGELELFADLSASSNASRAIINPFYNQYTVPADAPTNPFRQNVRIVFPTTDSAALTTDSRTRSATVGLLLPLARDWSSELDYTWSRSSYEYLSPSGDTTALNAAFRDGVLNPFIDTLAHPLNLSPYLTWTSYEGDSTLNNITLRASGPVGKLPAGSPVIAAGVERRRESTSDADYESVFGVTTANNVRRRFFGQSQTVESFYLEGRVPLVAPHNAIPAVHSLELQIAGRSERYSVDTGTPYVTFSPPSQQAFDPPQGVRATKGYTSTNPTIGFKYEPLAGLALRASYATAFLPPTAAQLLANPTRICGAPCVAIVDPQNGQEYSVDYTSGGNPNLNPQTARSWNFGLIWEPDHDALRGLRVNLEYYDIIQPNYIVTSPSAQQIVNEAAFGSRVTRDNATGLVAVVDLSPVNATKYKTSGYDLKVSYEKAIGIGTLGLHAAGSRVQKDLRQYAIGSPFLEFAGYPNDGGEGEFKGNLTVSWRYGSWVAAWTATHFSSYTQLGAPGGPYAMQNGELATYTDAQGGYTVPAQTYHDVYASYAFDSSGSRESAGLAQILSGVTVQVGVKNLFDELPPFDAAFGSYYYSPYGDPRLREYRVSLRKVF